MDILKKQFEYCGIDKYHDLGYKGKGITILNHEKDSVHARMTKQVLLEVAPEATIIDAAVSSHIKSGVVQYYNFEIDGIKYTAQEMYNKFRPDIMSVSFAGDKNDELLEEYLKPLIQQGLIIVNAAGNDGGEGVSAKYKNIAIKIAAATFTINNNYTKPVICGYSSYDNDININFAAFLGSNGSGTSAAAPFFAGQVALLFSRFKRLKQDKLVEFLSKNTIDIGVEGIDNKSGYGIVKLPDKMEIEMSNFIDTNGHWAEKEIDKAVENGIATGYLDGTFKPDATLTRAEAVVMINRAIERMGK